MNIQEYVEKGRYLYDEFSHVIANILQSAINNTGDSLGVQQIQHRGKSVKSLSGKLSDRDIYHSDQIEHEIKDLAGCRVIFYHNDDLNRFLRSNIISDNLSVDWDQSKFHHPEPGTETVNDFYMANHYVVYLTKERLGLPEFSKFAGFRCEIQLQTLLNHAWAETVHDITYKRRDTPGFGTRLRNSIENRLKSIMTENLRPAGYEFQKIKLDYDQLIRGQELISKDLKSEIVETTDNNALHDLLVTVRAFHILPLPILI